MPLCRGQTQDPLRLRDIAFNALTAFIERGERNKRVYVAQIRRFAEQRHGSFWVLLHSFSNKAEMSEFNFAIGSP